jgi:serine/threonine protein kinase/Flp pilus assembly protein TadD
MVGRTISHYRILAKLGEGGMGSVFRAHDEKLDRDVALKFITGGFSRDDDRKRFIREAQAAASLQHPNICPIYEVDEFQGRIFFVMAYLEGKTLGELIEDGPLPIEQAVNIARQVAAGLDEAHEHGIVHRDIKSSNIIVNAKGRAILLDFGLAQRAGQSRLTATGAAMGTAPYMSPEQAQGDLTDARTDIWSLGVVLYEALAGQLPFEAPHHLATLYSIINEDPPAITEHRPEVSEDLASVVKRGLTKDKAERYQTASEILADLGGELAHQSSITRSRVVSGAQVDNSGGRPNRVKWMGAIAASAVGVVVLAGTWIYLGGDGGGPRPTPTPLTPTAEALYTQGQYYLQRYEESSNLDQAITLFEDAKSESPGNSAVEAGLAEAYYRKYILIDDRKWLEGALAAADRALELDGGSAQALSIRGLVNNARGQTTQAISDFQAALEIDESNADATRGLANSYADQGRTEEAEEQYKKAIELDPSDWTGYKTLGIFYFKQARFDDAEQQFRNLIRLTPDNALAYSNLGLSLMMQGRFNGAAESLEKSISISPRAGAYSNLGTVRFYQERFSESVEAYQNAIEINPNNETNWGNLGDGLRRHGQSSDEAADAYRRAIELLNRQLVQNPNDAHGRAKLAYWLACLGRDRDAQAELLQALQISPNDADVLFEATLVHEFSGRREKAIDSYKAALTSGYSLQLAGRHPDLGAVSIAASQR